MLRFDFLERLGVRVAAISGRSEGDCSGRAVSMRARAEFLGRCGVGIEGLVCPRQVHGIGVVRVREANAGRGGRFLGESDGLMTDVPGLAMGVAVADCVPVYLFEAKRGVGAILHAGRAGTQANMAGAGVRGLSEEFGAVPGEMFAVIGPSAGPCCYEVSTEMAEVFGAAGWVVRGRNLDLWETNRMQLVSAGVPEGQIEVCGRCTICDGGFHSYRAHGTAARNLAVLVL